jgi:hypothetical protein
MGSSGSFSTEVTVEYSIKSDTKNTKEAIEKFLALRADFIITESIEVTEKNIREAYTNEWHVEMVYAYDESCDSDNYTVNEMVNEFDELSEHALAKTELIIKRKPVAKDIEYLDLEQGLMFEGINPNFIITKYIGSNSGYIYCDTDNREYESYKLSMFAKYMNKKDAKIVITSDGASEW